MQHDRPDEPLLDAATNADEELVRQLLAEGAAVDGAGEVTALWNACASDAPDEQRLAIAKLLLELGASPRRGCVDEASALHAAARRGPRALVELLIRNGALSWQTDAHGHDALDYAKRGAAPDREAIVELLDRPVILDPRFRKAVDAIHAGADATLAALLDQHPELLRMRAPEPDCYPQGYFSDPKLFWFVANNPTLIPQLPANVVAIAKVMVERGVDPTDLDYTLGLAMTNAAATDDPHLAELITFLSSAGAAATSESVLMTLGHGVVRPIEALLESGLPMSAPIAAALGDEAKLSALLDGAEPGEVHAAFSIAVIDRRVPAARLCLDRGANPNARLAVHQHSTALHQAAIQDDIEMLELLVERGARHDAADTLWNGTALGWAIHAKKSRAEAYLRTLG